MKKIVFINILGVLVTGFTLNAMDPDELLAAIDAADEEKAPPQAQAYVAQNENLPGTVAESQREEGTAGPRAEAATSNRATQKARSLKKAIIDGNADAIALASPTNEEIQNQDNLCTLFDLAVQKCADSIKGFDENRWSIVKLLFTKASRDNKRILRYNSQALHIAAKLNNPKIILELCKLQFSTNVFDIAGYTPLHYAARHFSKAVAENATNDISTQGILIANGASRYITSNNEECITYEEIIAKNKAELDANENRNNCSCGCVVS